MNTQQQTLVLGTTGKTGRRVVNRLHDRSLDVREGSRHGEPRFDWNDDTTWPPIVDGMDAVYIAYHPDLAAPGAPETVQAFADIAIDRGVRKLVLLSGRGEVEAQRAEQELLNTSADVTVVRCAWFMQNFSEDFMHASVMSGRLVLPGADGREPFVDADDIADVGEVFGNNAYVTDGVQRALGRPARDLARFARDAAAAGAWTPATVVSEMAKATS